MYLTPDRLCAARILVVDDEEIARMVAVQVLTDAGYIVTKAASGEEALAKVAESPPSMVLLDVNMPGLNGFEVARELRRSGYRHPVLMLTSYDDTEHIVQGLAMGADDYITKPVDFRVLLARVHALLRRGPARMAVSSLRFGETVVDLRLKVAHCHDEPLELTCTEYALLSLLAKHVGEPVSRADMLANVWGYAAETNTRTVDTHMWRLRKKLGDDGEEPRWIHTRQGVGYVLAAEVAESALAAVA